MIAKRILIIIPNLGTGGAQKVFRQQLHYLGEHYNVMGCVFNWDGTFPEDRNMNIHSLDVLAGTNTFLKAYRFVQRIIRLRRLKKKLKIDVTISHLEGADYVNLFSRIDDKIICWIHGTKKFDANIYGKMGWLRKRILIPFTYNRADELITVSDGIRNELRQDFNITRPQLKTIYNGFDKTVISAQLQKPLPSHIQRLMERRVIIVHCRLAVQKNLFALLKVFNEIRMKTTAVLVILGDGELRDDLLSASMSLGLRTYNCWENLSWDDQHDVYFLGYQSNPYNYLSRARMYLMTSGWEGFPLALCEAMACGLPVAATDCYTGPREILAPALRLQGPTRQMVKGEYGVLLPLIDPNSETAIQSTAADLLKIFRDDELLLNYSHFGERRVADFELSSSIQSTRAVIDNI